MAELNAKQQSFVNEYCIDKNATQAAIRAGYSEKTAYSIGNENLNKPEIKAAIEKQLNVNAERCAVTVESLTQELNDAIAMSYKQEDPNALRQAIMAKAKIHGLDVNINRNEDTIKFADVSEEIMTPDEWKAACQ